MKTIFEHTKSNVLVIPQALFAMEDVKVLCQRRNSAIMYKCLKQDLRDVEFYTNVPCFIFIESGCEVITNSFGDNLVLSAGSSIFLPQGLNLQSDFVKKTESLKAYLVFFDDDVVMDYLSRTNKPIASYDGVDNFYLSEQNGGFATFFDSVRTDIKAPNYLNIKLQELLHLIAYSGNPSSFHSMLATKKRVSTKHNYSRLIETLDVLHLTVTDLAHLSGRSLSSFNRDFKETYSVTPKKWLLEKKMARAKVLLAGEELSVTDVAMTLGYENVSAFIRAFKLQYGVTPKQIKL